MRKIRIAQIGTNYNSHGPQIFRSLCQQSELFDVVGYALPENGHDMPAGRRSCFEGCREMALEDILNDPTIEAVTVETDETYLTKYARLAVEHGKHVHMEKPGGIDPAAFTALIDAVKAKGTVFHIGYMYRYNPMVRDLMARIRRGELGDIISVEAQMNCHHNDDVREFLNNYPGGMMFYLGCHLIDLILQIQGAPQQILPLNRKTGVNGIGSEDFGMAVFTYPNGISFAKTSAFEYGGYLRRQLVVTGTRGTVELKPLEYGSEMHMFTDMRESREHKWSDPGVTSTSAEYNRYDSMLASFAAMVRGEQVNPCTPDYELELYRTIMTCCGISC